MFKRLCMAEPIEVYASANDMLEGWYGFNRQASKKVVKAFEFDPENYLYFRNRAITCDEMNANGDIFPHDEVKKAYASFIGKGIFYNHNSDDPNNSMGIILDANFVEPVQKHAYVELLCAVDKKLAEQKYPGLLYRVESGLVSGTSMGTFASEAECCICHNRTYTLEGLCEHMNPDDMHYCKGKLINASTNEYGAEINYGLCFCEDSIVESPADSSAHIFQIYAQNKDKIKEGHCDKEVINTLIQALNVMAKNIK